MIVCATALALIGASGEARAYTYDSTVSDGCHESITAAALRLARAKSPALAPLGPTEDERALIDDVPFALPSDMDDLGAATLLLAVRDNDLKGRHPTDTDQLALVHGDPALQREHCLRSPSHDEPEGSRRALDECVAFVREAVRDAATGLDEGGAPDATDRVTLPVTLAIRGKATPSLPRFYVRAGQAMHALQDSFTHTFRSSDGTRVRVVLNWIDDVEGDLDEKRDGPAHMRELDRCDDPDALRTQRRKLATEASAELLSAALSSSPEALDEALDALVARYMSYEEGCTFGDRWCDAPELAYRDTTCGCRVGEPAPTGSLGLAALTLAALSLRARRKET